MLRFTIRDVLWLTVVVGLAICAYGNYVNQQRLAATNQRLAAEKEALRQSAVNWELRYGRLLETAAKQRWTLRQQGIAD
jgi:hypothetical protein